MLRYGRINFATDYPERPVPTSSMGRNQRHRRFDEYEGSSLSVELSLSCDRPNRFRGIKNVN